MAASNSRIVFLVCLATVLILQAAVWADTPVSGDICSDTTWTTANSPYVVVDNVRVCAGATLTIEPGVTVRFGPTKALQIEGTLIARGTIQSRIIFTSDSASPTPGDWGYILFTDSSTDASFDPSGNYTTGSILQHCVVEYGGGASVSFSAALRMNNAHPFVTNCAIRNSNSGGICAWNVFATLRISRNTVTDNALDGIDVWAGTDSGGTIWIENNTIENNGGAGVEASQMTAWQSHHSLTIMGNTIINNAARGILLVDSAASTTHNIVGNVIIGNRTSSVQNPPPGCCAPGRGAGIYHWGMNTVRIVGNIIRSNTATDYGGGIFNEWDAVSDWPFSITNNVISDNVAARGAGIYLSHRTGILVSNNTVTDNAASSDGGGLFVSWDSSATMVNNILVSNSSGVYNSGSVTPRNNCVYGNTAYDYLGMPNPTGTNGNISEDPMLATDTVHLLATSPCIESGDDSAVEPGAVDIDGEPRIQGAHVDLGADECSYVGFMIRRVTPSTVGNSGAVTVTVRGSGFQSGATVKVCRSDEPATCVDATDMTVIDSAELMARFDFGGVPVGSVWDITVTNPDQTQATLTGALTLAQPQVNLWADIAVSDQMRIGSEQVFTVLYGNSGNIDAVGVPLWVAGIPKGSTLRIWSALSEPDFRGGLISIDFALLPEYVETETDIRIPLLISVMPAGSAQNLQFGLTITTDNDFQLAAWLNKPLFCSPLLDSWLECAAAFGENFAASWPPILDCQWASWQLAQAENNLRANGGVISQVDFWMAVLNVGVQCGGDILSQIPVTTIHAAMIENVLDLLLSAYGAVRDERCIDAWEKTWDFLTSPIHPIRSWDPNEKVATAGYGPKGRTGEWTGACPPDSFFDLGYISPNKPIQYIIRFENIPSASASAEDIVVTDTLDPNLDWTTLQLGESRIGGQIYYPVAFLNWINRTITWTFTGVNLPPNQTPPEGEGSVSFSVKPLFETPTGTEIHNYATIVFDANPPMCTNEVIHTIDAGPPFSTFETLSGYQRWPVIILDWQGQDDAGGCGVGSYSLYGAIDGTPVQLFQSGVTETRSVFTGGYRHTYDFYVAGRDNVGNLEVIPFTPDVTVTTGDGFSDIPEGFWAFTEIYLLALSGISLGYPDGTYGYAIPVFRDQMAVFISRALAEGDANIPDGPATPSFPDVLAPPDGHWAYKYIEYAHANGIVFGYPEGDYKPSVALDRSQMAVFIARAIATPTGDAGVPDPECTEPPFPDVSCDFWARKYIQSIKERGVTQGYPDGLYHHEYECLRDQMAVYVTRAFQLPM